MPTSRILLVLNAFGFVFLTAVGASATAAGATAYTSSTAARVVTEDPAGAGKLLLMLDASGSMNEPDPSGLTKMDAAKKALTGVVDSLPARSEVGLRVYGATVQGGTPTPEACADTQLVSPIKALDKAGLTAAIAGFQAKGETPIAHSLEKAIGDLGATGKRNIILVSDGEESCVPDPCPVVQKLIGAGIDLQIDTVGFAVGDKARQQLQCIADAGHGTYYDAANADQIAASLRKLSTRAVREFAINGKPIDGTPAEAGAPTLEAGLWVDTLTTGAKKHYVLKRSIPGSTMRVTVSARPPVDPARSGNVEEIRFHGLKPGTSDDCDSGQGSAQRIGMSHLRTVTSGSVLIPGGTTVDPAPCGAESVPFWIEREEGSDTPVKVEILVIEEPPLASDPPAATPSPSIAEDPVLPENPQATVGGSSFSDAPEITAGSWTEQFVPGEAIFYRVHLEWGQALRVTVPSPDNPLLMPQYDAYVYSPDRAITSSGPSGMSSNKDATPVARTTPPVLYGNRASGSGQSPANLAGDYYIAIAMPTPLRDADAGSLFPVTFRVDIEGTAQPGPDYAKPESPSPSASTASVRASDGPDVEAGAGPGRTSGSVLPWVGGGLLALAVLAGIMYAVARRRPSNNPTNPTLPTERNSQP
ncbi:MAG TPA: VWA domain-containing protein [Phycicoccus sp.]|nr:VWA domain-containing protein [Phycicoccus sp.]HQH07445.1 VWA domain-containing protein [Phycicoccus sp.]